MAGFILNRLNWYQPLLLPDMCVNVEWEQVEVNLNLILETYFFAEIGIITWNHRGERIITANYWPLQ